MVRFSLKAIGYQALRELPGYQYLPVSMLPTQASDEMKMKGKTMHANGRLVKPSDAQRLA
jgi:two-component system chemotaxis response regulator CheY